MTYRLFLVESPAKQKRIAAILGAGWRVEATRGHVRDLPQAALGIDVKDDFRPQYEVLPRQANTANSPAAPTTPTAVTRAGWSTSRSRCTARESGSKP